MDEIKPVPIVEPEFKTTLTAEQADAAATQVRSRSFAARHPEFGKMKNCQVCNRRHREYDVVTKEVVTDGVKTKKLVVVRSKCEQVFTNKVKDKDGRMYEQFREEIVPANEETGDPEKVTLVPDLRTAVNPQFKPTLKQVIGRSHFAKKRFHPHPSKIKLQFIERTRAVFDQIGFYLLDEKSDKFKELTPEVKALVQKDFQEDLQRARIIAARQIRKEREISDREYRRRQDQSRRINHGLKLGRNRV